jgi:hypothetical protein
MRFIAHVSRPSVHQACQPVASVLGRHPNGLRAKLHILPPHFGRYLSRHRPPVHEFALEGGQSPRSVSRAMADVDIATVGRPGSPQGLGVPPCFQLHALMTNMHRSAPAAIAGFRSVPTTSRPKNPQLPQFAASRRRVIRILLHLLPLIRACRARCAAQGWSAH